MNFNVEKAIQYVNGMQGYRLDNIHFRIGSKYHSNTFVHARVLLQNSYYTSRIALILARKIVRLSAEKKLSAITLVGYERYSELLLGLVANFLHAMNSALSTSICIMVDEGMMSPITKSSTHCEDFFAIVPIASTGNTAVRVIRAYGKLINQKRTAIHVYHVFQLSPDDYQMALPNSESLIKIPVEWYVPHDCKLCYNEKLSIPLFDADKTHLNPVAIFGFPSVKTVYSINDETRYQRLDGDEVETDSAKPRKVAVYGNPFSKTNFSNSLQYHRDNHFNDFRAYSHDTDIFITDNRKEIEHWIDRLRDDLEIHATDRIFILSPCHVMTNIRFVNLINNRLFGSSATVIYLEPGKEYPENFKRVNHEFLNKDSDEQIKIFFVDDDLVTGKSFFEVYDLFRYSGGYGNVVLSGAIFLMNKAPADINERVCRASGRIHSFVCINLPQRYYVSNQGPFSREIKRYEAIMERCLYYEHEKAFYEKCCSVRSFTGPDNNKDRHLQMFYSTHTLYDFFSVCNVNDSVNLSFEELWKECQKRDSRITDRLAVLKVVVRNSFTMYKPVKDMVFRWVKDEMCRVMTEIQDSIESQSWQKPSIVEELLFMIHRSALVGNYQVLSAEFFCFLSKFFSVIQDNNFISRVTNVFEQDLYAPEGYQNDILKRYIEIIVSNPAVTVAIKNNLTNVSFDSREGQAFKSKLLDETFVVVHDFFEYISALGFSPLGVLNEKKDGYVVGREYARMVDSWMNVNKIKDSSRFKWVDIVAGNDNRSLSQRFIQYLWLKSFLICDQKNDLSIVDFIIGKKTDTLCQHIKELINTETGVGLFFVITDVLGKKRLVFDEDENGYSVLKNRFTDTKVSAFFDGYLSGIQNDERVCIEIDKGDSLDDIFSYLNAERIQLFRIGDINDDCISGLIGAYSSNRDAFNEIEKRYMLLLRRDIMQFIKHHHRNDEFSKAVMLEERRKFAYLTGHGREVMLRLSWSKPIFIPIIATQERLQSVFSGSQNSSKSIKELLDIFFPSQTIDESMAKSILDNASTMAQAIYESDIVELSEDPIYWPCVFSFESSFKFNPDLLKFIFFELILNAKKNRFHKCVEPFNKVYSCEFDSNCIGIGITYKNQELTISVSGTGPDVPDDIINRINANSQIKEKEDISGLDLIIQLIREFGTQNRLSIRKESFISQIVFKNTVSVMIKF